ENLIIHGKKASTPVILIQWGTFGRQKTLQGTLADITEKVKAAKFSNPAIILVGEVISLRQKISWFEAMPLYGRQILLARTSEGMSGLAEEL
ncbi:bifunctional uroporphyrinogen-III C-methyltransferase/uroporphyrinogen-III synthase, partial [Alkalihalophilus pseudofirmus]|nr:bifunctional uroporphyrinogen-III C-methyltransferase/uroporphyrinogen-III synthase [Alkalihalophilus pseudofirmus]